LNWYKIAQEEELWRLKRDELKELLKARDASIDNPGGDWLIHEQDRARELVSKGYRSGSVTARFYGVTVPVSELLKLKGMTGEHLRLDFENIKVKELAESIKKEGLQQLPFVNVEYNGDAKINEGNHRIRAAHLAGLKTIPIEIAYFAGGERADGPMSLKRLVEFRNELL